MLVRDLLAAIQHADPDAEVLFEVRQPNCCCDPDGVHDIDTVPADDHVVVDVAGISTVLITVPLGDWA